MDISASTHLFLGLPLEFVQDQMIAADALAGAEYLGFDTLVLHQVIAETDPELGEAFETTLHTMQTAFFQGCELEGRRAQRDLGELIGKMKPREHWQQIWSRIAARKEAWTAGPLDWGTSQDRLTNAVKNFDLLSVTLEEFNQMGPEDQTKIAERLFSVSTAIAAMLFRKLFHISTELSRADYIKEWEQAYSIYEKDIENLQRLEAISEASPIAQLYRALWSALRQIFFSQIDAGRALQRLKTDEAFSFEEAKKMLKDPLEIVSRKLKDDGTFYHGAERGYVELEDTMFAWLDKHFPKRIRLQSGWQFVGRKETEPQKVQNFNPPSWPPDPETDLHWKSYLNLIGWQMKVEQDGTGGITVTLTAEDPIPTSAMPKLVQKFVKDIQDFLTANEVVIRGLVNIKGLEEQLAAFNAESTRLLALFPKVEDPDLDLVIWQSKSSLHQFIYAVIGNMEMSLEELKLPDAIFQPAIDEIPKYPQPLDFVPVAQNMGKFQVDCLFKELAIATTEFFKYRKPVERWNAEKGIWMLTYDKQNKETTSIETLSNPFYNFPWPPDPAKQPALQLALDLLGWEMNTLEDNANQLTIEVRAKIRP